jgi:hypothetical protein
VTSGDGALPAAGLPNDDATLPDDIVFLMGRGGAAPLGEIGDSLSLVDVDVVGNGGEATGGAPAKLDNFLANSSVWSSTCCCKSAGNCDIFNFFFFRFFFFASFFFFFFRLEFFFSLQKFDRYNFYSRLR